MERIRFAGFFFPMFANIAKKPVASKRVRLDRSPVVAASRRRRRFQVHVLLRSAEKRAGPCVRQGLSNRIDCVWANRRFARPRLATGARAQTKWIRRRTTLRSSGDFSSRNSRILSDSRRTGGVRASTKTAGADDSFEIRMDLGDRDRNRCARRGIMRIRFSILRTRAIVEYA